MSEQLEPCPFCGNPNSVIQPNGIGDYYVICLADEGEMYCGASSSDRSCETEEHAAARWNARVSPPPSDTRNNVLEEAIQAVKTYFELDEFRVDREALVETLSALKSVEGE